MLIISQSEVPALLPMDECIEVMARALETLARGGTVQPLRPMLRLPGQKGILGMMPAYMDSPEALGVKLITVFNGNHGTKYDSHQGVVLLFEATHGSLVAIIDASSVTAIRTAAVSAVATRLLARAGANDLCILGSGVQAHSHLEAMRLVRTLERVRVWSRDAEHARAFARSTSSRYGITVEAMPTARDAAAGADIICTTTSSREPVLHGDWIAAGAHVNVVGSSTAAARELDTAAVVRARLFVDWRESTINEAGDFLIPKREGAIGDDHIQGEIGELLVGTCAGRQSEGDVTVFKSLGVAVEDVAAAEYVYSKAMERGVGISVELGGIRSL